LILLFTYSNDVRSYEHKIFMKHLNVEDYNWQDLLLRWLQQEKH